MKLEFSEISFFFLESCSGRTFLFLLWQQSCHVVCLKSFHCSLKLKLQLWFVGSTDLLELVYLFEKRTTRFWLSTTRVTGKPTNLAVRLKGLKVRFKFNFNSKIKSCYHRNLTHFKLSYHFHKPLNFNGRACISKHRVILRVF